MNGNGSRVSDRPSFHSLVLARHAILPLLSILLHFIEVLVVRNVHIEDRGDLKRVVQNVEKG